MVPSPAPPYGPRQPRPPFSLPHPPLPSLTFHPHVRAGLLPDDLDSGTRLAQHGSHHLRVDLHCRLDRRLDVHLVLGVEVSQDAADGRDRRRDLEGTTIMTVCARCSVGSATRGEGMYGDSTLPGSRPAQPTAQPSKRVVGCYDECLCWRTCTTRCGDHGRRTCFSVPVSSTVWVCSGPRTSDTWTLHRDSRRTCGSDSCAGNSHLLCGREVYIRDVGFAATTGCGRHHREHA